MNTEAKTNFEKDFLKLMNNSVFEKTLKSRRRNNFVSQPNYHTTDWFSDDLK